MKPLKDIPILMSGPMARAIIDGNKTETRRIVKPQPEIESGYEEPDQDKVGYFWKTDESYKDLKTMLKDMVERSPYGAWGRRFWVKETYYPAFKRTKTNPGCVYRADQIPPCLSLRPDWHPSGKGWKPSIFMPRWAARTEMLGRGVGVERLHQITEAGAAAEGIVSIRRSPYKHGLMDGYGAPGTKPEDACKTRRAAYEKLWKKINGPDSWAANPMVWVIKFERVK